MCGTNVIASSTDSGLEAFSRFLFGRRWVASWKLAHLFDVDGIFARVEAWQKFRLGWGRIMWPILWKWN